MKMSKPRAVIVLTSHDQAGEVPSGSWYQELAGPYYAFLDAGLDVILASIRGGAAPIDPASREDQWQTDDTRRFERDLTAQEKLANTVPVAELDAADLDAIFLCGGLAVMWDFPDNDHLKRLIESINQQNGIVSSVCHGAAGLLNARNGDGVPLISGREIVSWTDEEERILKFDSIVPFLLEKALREKGAAFRSGEAFSDTVRIDGNLITGQNPASARATGEAIAQALSLRQAAE